MGMGMKYEYALEVNAWNYQAKPRCSDNWDGFCIFEMR
jgi:hypothetical protein